MRNNKPNGAFAFPRQLLLSGTFLTALTFNPALAGDVSTPTDEASWADSAEGRITVTARRRDEDAQDLPIALSVVSADTLDKTGNFTFSQVPQLVPSLQIFSFNPRNTNENIRGLGGHVADEHRLRTGEDRAALFFSAFSVSAKAGMPVAVGIALPLVGWLGFDPQAGSNTPEALRGLLYVFALGSAIAHPLSAWLIHGFPLDEASHAKIRRALDARDSPPFCGRRAR